MSSDKLPEKKSNSEALAQFLSATNQLPQRLDDKPQSSGRLLFALDATASRQPSWDRACHLQAQMFNQTRSLGGLQLQLCYYRGFNEFHYTDWLADSHSLLNIMNGVQCLGGHTQLKRVLNHATAEHSRNALQAVVIIADAVEEDVDSLCALAGKLGILGLPLFMFQEGKHPTVRQCFKQMATLSKGAYAAFDDRSAQHLADLLTAVATFTTGGKDALQTLQSAAAKQLLQQLKG